MIGSDGQFVYLGNASVVRSLKAMYARPAFRHMASLLAQPPPDGRI